MLTHIMFVILSECIEVRMKQSSAAYPNFRMSQTISNIIQSTTNDAEHACNLSDLEQQHHSLTTNSSYITKDDKVEPPPPPSHLPSGSDRNVMACARVVHKPSQARFMHASCIKMIKKFPISQKKKRLVPPRSTAPGWWRSCVTSACSSPTAACSRSGPAPSSSTARGVVPVSAQSTRCPSRNLDMYYT